VQRRGSSLVKIQGNAGETLRIMVTGFGSASVGNFSVTVRPADSSNTTPRVTGVSRPASPPAGGATLTVSGEAFADGASVTVGGIPAKSVRFVDSHNLTITVPAHGAGPVDIVVANLDGSSGRLTGAFTYTPEPPITPRPPITRVPPRPPVRAL
jgi:hypothetical protein